MARASKTKPEGIEPQAPPARENGSSAPEAEDMKTATRILRYTVMRDHEYFVNGLTVRLRQGKVISTQDYDVAALRKMGASLEPVEAAG